MSTVSQCLRPHYNTSIEHTKNGKHFELLNTCRIGSPIITSALLIITPPITPKKFDISNFLIQKPLNVNFVTFEIFKSLQKTPSYILTYRDFRLKKSIVSSYSILDATFLEAHDFNSNI